MIKTKRITAWLLSATMFASVIGGSALAAQETSNPGVGSAGYVALQQYVQATSDPGVFKVSLTIQAPMDPKPADVMLVLDASGSMAAGMGGTGNPSRWAGAIEGANAAIDVFTDPKQNPAADKTRVGVTIYNSDSDDIVSLTENKADISKGMGTLKDFYYMTGSTTLPSKRPTLKTTPASASDTDLFLGVRNAYNQFEGNPLSKTTGGANDWLPANSTASKADTRKYVIFLSDGINTKFNTNNSLGDPSVALDLASYMKVDQNVTFMTIGLGIPPLNDDQSGATTLSSFSAASQQNYPNWNKKATVNYKAMIDPVLSTASGNIYPNDDISGNYSSNWFGTGWLQGGSTFPEATNDQAADNMGFFPARIPQRLNKIIDNTTLASLGLGTADGAYHPNALIGVSAFNSWARSSPPVRAQWLANSNENIWDGMQGYIDIPGDQYWSPGGTILSSLSDGPQALIYMAQMLNKQKLASRGVVLGAQSATTTLSTPAYINTWESSSPLLWGFESIVSTTMPKPVSSSSLNTGSFYWDNWISKQVWDYTALMGTPSFVQSQVGINYQAIPQAGFAQYGSTWGMLMPSAAIEEAPLPNSIGDVYNADTVLRNTNGEIVEPYFRPVSTLNEVVDAFTEFANKIIRFGENVKVSVKTNSNWQIIDRYGDMTDWYNLVGGFEGQTVTRSGNNISWDPVAIPMIGQSTLTYYVRFTGNQTDKNVSYPVIDECQISFIDNYDMQNLVNRVKNFPQALVNPSTNEIKESNVVIPNNVDNAGTPSTIGTTGSVINNVGTSDSSVSGTTATTDFQGGGGGIAFLGSGPQVYTASVANTAAAKKNKKTTTDKTNALETLSDSEYKTVKGKSLKAKSSKVAVYAEPKKDASVVLYFTKGKTFKIAGATENYYMIQYKKKDGKVQKGYILKTDTSLTK